jgi:hypothetical protein
MLPFFEISESYPIGQSPDPICKDKDKVKSKDKDKDKSLYIGTGDSRLEERLAAINAKLESMSDRQRELATGLKRRKRKILNFNALDESGIVYDRKWDCGSAIIRYPRDNPKIKIDYYPSTEMMLDANTRIRSSVTVQEVIKIVQDYKAEQAKIMELPPIINK